MFQKLLCEFTACFPLADANNNTVEVLFWRRWAEAERYVGLEVADEDMKELGRDSEEDMEKEGVDSKILS